MDANVTGQWLQQNRFRSLKYCYFGQAISAIQTNNLISNWFSFQQIPHQGMLNKVKIFITMP